MMYRDRLTLDLETALPPGPCPVLPLPPIVSCLFYLRFLFTVLMSFVLVLTIAPVATISFDLEVGFARIEHQRSLY